MVSRCKYAQQGQSYIDLNDGKGDGYERCGHSRRRNARKRRTASKVFVPKRTDNSFKGKAVAVTETPTNFVNHREGPSFARKFIRLLHANLSPHIGQLLREMPIKNTCQDNMILW
ncbi:hypothetical protein ACFX1S_040185 [Malus domestica]